MINSETMKKMLDDIIGPSRNSLIIGDNCQKDPNTLYYFDLPDEDKILRAVEAINVNYNEAFAIKRFEQFNESSYLNRRCYRKNQNEFVGRCIEFNSYPDGNWKWSYINTLKICYQRKSDNQIFAYIKTGSPSFTISSACEDSFYEIFCREVSVVTNGKMEVRNGIKYDVNIISESCMQIRKIISQIFYEEARMKNKYILKDVGRIIENQGWFLPDIDIDEILRYRTPKELVRNHYSNSNYLCNINFNKIDLNSAYVMCKLQPVVSRRSVKYLYSDINQNMLDFCFRFYRPFEGMLLEEMVAAYYASTLNAKGEAISVRFEAMDYATMCIRHNIPIRLGMDQNALTSAHDELSRFDRRLMYEDAFKTPLVKVPSVFDDLENKLKENYGSEFERIKDMKRLFDEGENQSNCVFSRRELIINDEISIFHWRYKEKDYTVQISIYGDRYLVDEIKGKFNEEPTIEIIKEIYKKIEFALEE